MPAPVPLQAQIAMPGGRACGREQIFLGHLIPRLPGEWIQEVREGLAGGFLGKILAIDPYFRTLEYFALPAQNWLPGRRTR